MPKFKKEEISAEEFLQISSSIISTFKSRIPVSLYTYSEEMNRVESFLAINTRITPKKNEQITKLCDDGNLFIPKKEYQVLAEHLSKNLGSLLTEHYLGESAAHIFHKGLKENLTSFFNNPIIENLEELKKNLAIFGEYLWVDRQRASYFFNALDKANCIYTHCVNTLFTGVALFLTIRNDVSNLNQIIDFALGLIIHDIGMTQLPSVLKNKEGPLLYKEKLRIQEHVDISEKMLNRLEINNEIVLACVIDHHERLNGSGYPKGKKEDRISFEARICAVADVFCAMISARPYRQPINPILAAIILTKCTDRFDQTIVNSVLKFIISQNSEMGRLLKDNQKLAKLHAMAASMCKQ